MESNPLESAFNSSKPFRRSGKRLATDLAGNLWQVPASVRLVRVASLRRLNLLLGLLLFMEVLNMLITFKALR